MKFAPIILAVAFFVATPALAQEIYYARITDIHDTSVALTYTSPSGDKEYVCDTKTLDCDEAEDRLIPEQADGMTKSPHGNYAVQFNAGNLSATIYTVEGDKLERGKSLTFDNPALLARFTRDEEKLVVLHDAYFSIYNLNSDEFRILPYTENRFSHLLISPEGQYATYATPSGITALGLESGFSAPFPAEDAAYMEISENGQWGAYKERTESGTTLWIVDLSNFPQTKRETAYTTQNEIDDYIFFENKLYFTTNGERSEYDWNLMQYDPTTKDDIVIDSSVSYLEHMRTATGALLYHKIDNTTSSIYALREGEDSGKRLEGIEPKTIRRDIERSDMTLANIPAVLIEPEDTGRSDGLPLLIWLHGGPMRQTSLGYHPYPSYAVYDELLEKIADSGFRVLKLDYPGSWGYGKEYQEKLQGNIGTADRISVYNAIKEFTDRYETKEVHLMGNSYGAYLALRYAVEHPNQTKTVSFIAGVSDWRSLISRIPSSVFTPRFNGVPNGTNEYLYQQADLYFKLPLLHSTTKLLVVYGELDTTIPIWQSKDLIQRTQLFGIPTDTLIFEDEGHVIRKRESLDKLCRATEDILKTNIDCS